MNQLYDDFFKTIHEFQKIRWSDLFTDISGGDFLILKIIEGWNGKSEHQKITTSQLAEKMKVSSPSVSRSLKVLETKGLVNRTINEEDRRNVYVELTPEGRRVMNEEEQSMMDFGRSVIEQMDPVEMRQLVISMQHLNEISKNAIRVRKEKRKGQNHD